MAKHVLSVHSYGSVTEEHGKPAEGELSVEFLKKCVSLVVLVTEYDVVVEGFLGKLFF